MGRLIIFSPLSAEEGQTPRATSLLPILRQAQDRFGKGGGIGQSPTPSRRDAYSETFIADYLGPTRDEISATYTVRKPKRQVAEAKAKYKKK
jgi:hypothetical protein